MKKIVNIFKLLFFVFFITFLCGINTVKAIDYISQTSTSLVNWMLEEDNLSNGYYSLVVNGQTYLIRLYTYNGDQVWTSNMTFGDGNDIANSSRNAQHMIVVKVRGDLTINSGVTVTTTNSTYGGPKGFFLFSSGKLTNNGTITMTARGARAAGQPVYLYKDPTNGYTGFTVPATGGSGGAARTYTNKSINTSSDYYLVGDPGKAGSNRGTGGGGSGGLETRRHDYSSFTATSGAGSAGTSYSGGTGGGGINMNYNGTRAAGGGAANGGAGGNGWSARGSSSWAARSGGGGAGNPGGTGYYTKSGSTTCSADSNYSAPSGTGGLLIIFSISFDNKGTITSQGVRGGNASSGGGGSGGGSINILSTNFITKGSPNAGGGAAGIGGASNRNGGTGGAGTVTFSTLVLEPEYLHPTLKSLIVNGKDVTLSFTSDNRSYSFALDAEDYRATIAAELTNLNNDITGGVGLFDIPAGSSTHVITLTSYIGITETYTIEFYRTPSSYKYLKNITLDDVEIDGFSPTKFSYDINLDSTVESIDIKGIVGRPS